jgi:hypothetical protein
MKLPWNFYTLGLALLIFHVIISAFVTQPGYLSADAGTYHLMLDSRARGDEFNIQTGYSEYPHPSLRIGQLFPKDSTLVSQYPEFYTFAALPFYPFLGFRSFFFLNATAFVFACFLTGKLALLLFSSKHLEQAAMLLYAMGTFAWSWSQTSYPHIFASLPALLATLLVARIVFTPLWNEQSLMCALLAGFAAGFGLGVRLENIFTIPALVLVLLLWAQHPKVGLSGFIGGMTPPLAILMWINWIKFGSPNPLSYGDGDHCVRTSGIVAYLPIAIYGVLAFVALLLLFRKRGAHPWQTLLLMASIFVAGLFWLSVPHNWAHTTLEGFVQLVLDLRWRPLEALAPMMSRSPHGAVVFIGNVKKSLLQSLPYVVLTLVSLVPITLQRGPWKKLVFLWLVVAGTILIFSYMAWDGNLSLNMRYFVGILPFLSILVVWSLRNTIKSGSMERIFKFSILLSSGCVAFFPHELSIRTQELLFLNVPLCLAALCFLLAVATRFLNVVHPALRSAYILILSLSFAWSGAVAFTRDFRETCSYQAATLVLDAAIATSIQPDSLLISPIIPYSICIPDRSVRVAQIGYSEGITNLARFHLGASRPVYLLDRISDSKLHIFPDNAFTLNPIDFIPDTEQPVFVLYKIQTKKLAISP